ncbi:hypothetical protein [Mumia sp. Pv 4-285]|uniref:hypothetical protein n=1 Tax=Mumia qirimensis TaxID=3234852 RepID=UPI00351CCC5D
MKTFPSALSVPASVAGAGLAGAAFGLAAALRRFGTKPLHPRGVVVEATLTRHGVQSGHPSSGVEWIDEPGRDQVLVRMSRAVGLPSAWPDVHGLALRVPMDGDAYADVLLASTGWRGLSRFVLTASRRSTSRPMTTLLPYRSSSGPLLIGAETMDRGTRLRLSWATRLGPWQPFAVLELSSTEGPDPAMTFDPVLHPLPGLENYAWVRRLREPAYATARASRSD